MPKVRFTYGEIAISYQRESPNHYSLWHLEFDGTGDYLVYHSKTPAVGWTPFYD